MIRDIGEIQALATKYSKPQLARMAQMGLIEPTKAVMAGMMIDRITKSNLQPPQRTVADDALTPMQPPMPQAMQQPPVAPGGIGALPAQLQPNAGVAALPSGITEMAVGGIVAFGDGGDVPGYADEGLVRMPMSGFMGAPGSAENANMFQLMNEATQRPSPVAELFRGIEASRQENIADYKQRLANIQQKMATGVPLTPQEQTLARYNNLTAASNPSASPEKMQNAVNAYRQITTPSSSAATNKDLSAAQPSARRGPAAPTVQQPTGLQSIPTVPDLAVPKGLGSFETEAYKMPQEKTLKGAISELEDADRAAGVNTDIYKDLMKDIEGKKGKLAERKQEAIGNALMQTGLGLLGARRGQEFAVLGEAGQRSLQGLINANEKILQTEEKLDDARRSLLVAENDYKRTRSDKAFDTVQKSRDKIENLEIKNVDNRNSAAQERAKIGVQLFSQEVSLQGQKVQQRGQDIQRQTSLETTKMTTDAQVLAARIHAAAANRPGETERMMAEHNRILKTQGPEAAEKYLQLQERIAGRGKASGASLQEQYADDWNKMDIMQRKNMKDQGITTEQQYIDYRLKLAGRQPTSQQGGGRTAGTLPPGWSVSTQ